MYKAIFDRVKNCCLALKDIHPLDEYSSRRLAGSCNILDGHKRIYHYHVRKTAGSSINFMFFESADEDSAQVYRLLYSNNSHRAIIKDKVFVGWNNSLIEKGHYYYAFSHMPMHKINVPKDTFTITSLRDPVKRVISHYNMLLGYKDNSPDGWWLENEKEWLGNSLSEFISNMPRHHLLNQLFMFSEGYDIDEAFANISSCNFIFILETFQQDIELFNQTYAFNLKPKHVRPSRKHYQPTEAELKHLSELLEPEYILYNKILSHVKQQRAKSQ